MYMSFFELAPVLKDYFVREKPNSVLVVSKSSKKYVNFIKDIMSPINENIKLDKVIIDDQDSQDFENQKLYTLEHLIDERSLENYDCIFMTDVIEDISQETTYSILNKLLKFTKKSILVVTPMLTENQAVGCNSNIRMYHPVMFSKFDFSYISFPTIYGKIQLYSFFPQNNETTCENRHFEQVPVKTEKLKIGYVLPHKNLTGGLKCLLEQMRQLHRKGHTVYAIFKGQQGDSAIPAWSDINLDEDLNGQIIVSNEQDIQALSEKVDILMLGFMTQIPDYAGFNIPLVYWEQGSESLYGDYGALLNSDSPILRDFREIYHIPVHYLAVADIVADVLLAKYGVKSKLLYNGIDLSFYRPLNGKKFSATILLVGNPNLGFKNFSFALRVLTEVWSRGGKFKVKWACQAKPNISGLKFPIEYYVMLPQSGLAELYRTSDIFLFTSVYESFPMPPIEAMASGVPVIATDCGGINTYGRAGENMLLVDQEDIQSCVAALIFLLQNENARQKLSENGLKTAQEYSFDRIVENLEDYFYSLIAQKNRGNNK